MKATIIACLLATMLVCCKGKEVNKNELKIIDNTSIFKKESDSIKWDSIYIENLPFKYRHDYENDYLFALVDSLKEKELINEKSKLNSLFSDNTLFKRWIQFINATTPLLFIALTNTSFGVK